MDNRKTIKLGLLYLRPGVLQEHIWLRFHQYRKQRSVIVGR